MGNDVNVVICSHRTRWDQIVSKAEPSKPIDTCRACTLELTSYDPETRTKPDFKIHFLSNRFIAPKKQFPEFGRPDRDEEFSDGIY